MSDFTSDFTLEKILSDIRSGAELEYVAQFFALRPEWQDPEAPATEPQDEPQETTTKAQA